ncbi:MAG: hypothetical protein ACREN8_10705, partial [Candidatus Dormibacteraceae bacterium]
MFKVIEFLRNRARFYHCPVCGVSLDGCEIRMLKAVEDRFTVQLTCPGCSVQFMLILAVQSGSFESLGEEVAPAPVATIPDPIHSDEILDVHLLLKSFNGQLTDLLKSP